jgi:hypothetical protein
MREEGMLWSAREVSPLDKTEILDKTKNNEKIPLDKGFKIWYKRKYEKIPLDKGFKIWYKRKYEKIPLDKGFKIWYKRKLKTLERRCGMESLKEKNKKNARRCGMNKKELLSLALAGAGILGLAAGNVIAGGMSVNTKTVALEAIPASSDAKTGPYNSSEILVQGILALNATKITLKLDNGFFPNGTHIALCKTDNATPAANGTVSGDNATVELTTNYDIGSEFLLKLVSNKTATINCTNTDTYNKWVPVYIKGGLNDGDKVSLTIQQFKDTLFEVKQQYKATLDKVTDYLSPDYEYKKFRGGMTNSTARYYIKKSSVDHGANETSDQFEISLKGNFAGVKEAKVNNGSSGEVATLNATNNWTRSAKITDFGTNGTIVITVTGNDILSPRTFTVSLKTVASGRIKREIYYLKDEPSHEWLFPGITYYLPFVVARPNEETWIVLQAKKGSTQSSYTVTISALDDNGDFKSINAMPMNAGDRLVIKASDIKAQISSLTKDRFVVMINVDNADDTQIFAYANICRSDGVCRRVPVKAKGGMTAE